MRKGEKFIYFLFSSFSLLQQGFLSSDKAVDGIWGSMRLENVETKN